MNDLDVGRTTLKARARFVGMIIMVYLVFETLSLAVDLAVLTGAAGTDEGGALAFGIALFLLAVVAVFLVSVILVSMWIHRAHANLFAAGLDGLEYTPGWSVGWFFVPFANLVKPFQAMRELYNRSLGQDDGYNATSASDLTLWWGCYLAGSIAGNLSFRMDNGLILSPPAGATVSSIISSALLMASAVYLKRIVDTVTKAQDTMMGVAETFD